MVLTFTIFSLKIGSVNIDSQSIIEILQGKTSSNTSWSYIVENRFNRTLIALLSGAALATTGLILQIFFRNPLAGPGVLGISSGATLGVALVVLGGVTFSGIAANVTIIISGVLGALLILFILMFLSKYVRNTSTLLIVGLMLSYFTAAFVNTLYHWADKDESRQFIVWGLGSFEGIPTSQLLIIAPIIILSLATLFLIIKPLNALVLGSEYARSLGVNIKITKFIIIVISSVLTAIVTVYCGPVAFIGIAIPQVVRQLIRSSSVLKSILTTILLGALFALVADVVIRLSGNYLPLNTITAIVGAPVIIWTIVSMNSSSKRRV
jgi:iron complex transport system permease protein